jgi:hypothetical protein
MNILDEANKIVNGRTQEDERQYGPFNDCMDKTRDIFNAISGLKLSTENMFQVLMALKLARESYAHKEDNLLDLCGYIGGLNNYKQDHLEKESKK